MADGMGLKDEKLFAIPKWWGSEHRRTAALIVRILEKGSFWMK
jgi:hypothetical protein